jgi:hypothetical protein
MPAFAWLRETWMNRCLRWAPIAAGFFLPQPATAIDIQFNYTFDTNNFFNGHPERQAVMEQIALTFESRITDNLTAITPGGSNTWTAVFDNPSTGTDVNLDNLTIPSGVIVIYAGARNLPSGNLGIGGPGGFSAGGTQAFLNTVAVRGQLGGLANPETDFGPWGGSITFDIDSAWYFDPDITTVELMATMFDFYSVGLHEIGHLLGFGTAPSWDRYVNGTLYTGPASTAENGGVSVPLTLNGSHWAEGTMSDVTSPVTLATQEASMDPTLTIGQRKYFTELDFAGLADLGWQIIPEPSSAAFFLTAGFVLSGWVRRRPTTREV